MEEEKEEEVEKEVMFVEGIVMEEKEKMRNREKDMEEHM